MRLVSSYDPSASEITITVRIPDKDMHLASMFGDMSDDGPGVGDKLRAIARLADAIDELGWKRRGYDSR